MITARKVSDGRISCLGRDPIGSNAMESLWERARPVVGGLAVWVMLAGVAIAEDGSIAIPPVPQNGGGPNGGGPNGGAGNAGASCGGYYAPKECRQCGVPQVNLALAPDEWAPPCVGCDSCDPLRSCCPAQEDLYILPPRPRWYVVSELAVVRRNPTHNLEFASLGLVPTGAVEPTNVVLSTADFTYDLTPTGRLTVGHTFNECLQIEGVYFGVTQGENTAAVFDNTPNAHGGVGNLFSPFSGFGNTPIPGLDFNNFAQIQYTSSLYGAELYMRRKVPVTPPGKLTTSILFGARYLGLPENFDYNTTSDITKTGSVVTNGAVNSIHVATTNEMVGPEIGATFEFYVDNRWWVNVDMKAAIMNNHSHQTTTYTNVDTGTTSTFTGSQHGDHTAFAEEIAVTAVYRWTLHFTTQIGYRALWMQEVALAPDNLNTNIDFLTFGSSQAQLNHTSSTVYHGPYAGIVLAW
jgi:hypothetical protein